jgi:hypothetical protein
MRRQLMMAGTPTHSPALLDRVEITVPGRPNQPGQIRGHCRANGVDLWDVLFDDEKHTIIQNLPAERIVAVIGRKAPKAIVAAISASATRLEFAI